MIAQEQVYLPKNHENIKLLINNLKNEKKTDVVVKGPEDLEYVS